MTFTQISTSGFLLGLFGAQMFPGQNLYASHFGAERGKAIYITGKFPCMEKLSPLSVIAGLDLAWGESYPWVRLPCSRPVLEVLPCGSPVRMTPAIWALCHGRAHQCLLTRWALGEPDLRSFLAMPAVSHGAVLNTWGFAPPSARCGRHCLARGGGAGTWLLAA